MVTIEYRCADGTPFPVTFTSPEQAAETWNYDREHGRDPATPLGLGLQLLGIPGGMRAYEERGMVMLPMFQPGPETNGFPYFSAAPIAPEAMAVFVEGCTRLLDKHGSALGIWQDGCLPRIREVYARLRSPSSTNATLAELAEAQSEGLHLTMIAAMVTGNDLDLLTAACRDVCGDEATLMAYELTQGYDSATLSADQALWEVAQVAAADPALMAALGSADPCAAMASLRSSGSATKFFAALDPFLAEFGQRCESWDIALPAWEEEGEGLWAQVRHLASGASVEPRQAVAAGAARRQALAADISSRLADDPDKLARFERRLGRIAPYVAVREERAQWQLALCGALRHAVLARGDALVARGIVGGRDDVLYLEPDELDRAFALDAQREGDDLQALVAARRADHEARKRWVPPATIGGTPVLAAESRPAGRDSAGKSGLEGVLRGVAASRGVVTGPARVVLDLADADRVEPGDVLVCVMTSPPWTPLFAVASAIVADTGGMGSHPAIAAREYGIPCVLSVRDATASIPDGAHVRVDGAAGTVELL